MWLEYFEQYLDRVFPRFLNEKPWNYKDDLCMVGAWDLHLATGDDRWLEPVRWKAGFLMDEDGTVANWAAGEHNIDKVSFGKSMRILRDLTGEARWADAVTRAYHILDDYPRTATGNFWHKDIYPDQVWLDGLYMGMPFYAACLAETGEDRWDDILDQFASAHRLLWDETLGLYRHANDCSRKMEWADPVTGQSPAVWLRAEGWFLMALADTYEIAKDHTPPRTGAVPAAEERAGPPDALSGGTDEDVPAGGGPGRPCRELLRDVRQCHGGLRPDEGRTAGNAAGGVRKTGERSPGRDPGYLPEKDGYRLGAARYLRQRRAWPGTGSPHRPDRNAGILSERKADGGQPAWRCRLHDGGQRTAASEVRKRVWQNV